jgi:hypothetical protein
MVQNVSTYGRARDRKALRQRGALERAEQYSKLTLDEKINEQSRYCGKQYKKLMALKDAQK